MSRRPLNEREPVPRNELPPRPDWLDEEAGAKWDQLVYELHCLGVLRPRSPRSATATRASNGSGLIGVRATNAAYTTTQPMAPLCSS